MDDFLTRFPHLSINIEIKIAEFFWKTKRFPLRPNFKYLCFYEEFEYELSNDMVV